MNEVCKLMANRIANHRGSNPNSIMIGASTGMWMKVISMKSRMNPSTKIRIITIASTPHLP